MTMEIETVILPYRILLQAKCAMGVDFQVPVPSLYCSVMPTAEECRCCYESMMNMMEEAGVCCINTASRICCCVPQHLGFTDSILAVQPAVQSQHC